jgi:hypothetical protein
MVRLVYARRSMLSNAARPQLGRCKTQDFAAKAEAPHYRRARFMSLI